MNDVDGFLKSILPDNESESDITKHISTTDDGMEYQNYR